MRLIGMLDSPYVRRVAISLRFMGIPFAHEAISVFRQYDEFSAISPVVKAPTLVTDEGVTLTDSTLILDYAAGLAPADRRLMRSGPVTGYAPFTTSAWRWRPVKNPFRLSTNTA